MRKRRGLLDLIGKFTAFLHFLSEIVLNELSALASRRGVEERGNAIEEQTTFLIASLKAHRFYC